MYCKYKLFDLSYIVLASKGCGKIKPKLSKSLANTWILIPWNFQMDWTRNNGAKICEFCHFKPPCRDVRILKGWKLSKRERLFYFVVQERLKWDRPVLASRQLFLHVLYPHWKWAPDLSQKQFTCDDTILPRHAVHLAPSRSQRLLCS